MGASQNPIQPCSCPHFHSQGFPLAFVFPLSSVCPGKAAKGANSGQYSGLQAHRLKGLACILEGPLPTFSPSGPLWLRLKRLKCTPISLQIWDLPELISPSDSQIWCEVMSQEGKGWGELFTSTLAPPGLQSPQPPRPLLRNHLSHYNPFASIPMEVFSLQGPVLAAQNCSQPHNNYERVQRLHFQDDWVLLGRQPVSWQTS